MDDLGISYDYGVAQTVAHDQGQNQVAQNGQQQQPGVNDTLMPAMQNQEISDLFGDLNAMSDEEFQAMLTELDVGMNAQPGLDAGHLPGQEYLDLNNLNIDNAYIQQTVPAAPAQAQAQQNDYTATQQAFEPNSFSQAPRSAEYSQTLTQTVPQMSIARPPHQMATVDQAGESAVTPSARDARPVKLHESAPAYKCQIASFDLAAKVIQRKQDEGELSPVQIVNDDWQLVEINFQNWASRLHQALFHNPQVPSAKFEPYAVEYYWQHQNNTLSAIFAIGKSDPEEAEARVMLVLQEIINTHKFGVPMGAYNRNNKKFGYKVEENMTCSERLTKVINAATRDKYVAHDVLTGTNLKDMVRSPEAYLAKKVDNCRVNAKKVHDKILAGQNTRKLAPKSEVKSRGVGGKGRFGHGPMGTPGRKNTKGHAPRTRFPETGANEEGDSEALSAPQYGGGVPAHIHNKRPFDELDELEGSPTEYGVAKYTRMM